MKKIWEFFENMDECMYVADIDTHELIYMNKKALNIYGFKSVDEVAGKKCYEILQNSQVRAKSVTMKIYQLDSLRNGVILIRFSTNILF